MTNKNKELQERCEAIMYRCADKEDEFGGQTYKSLIDLKFHGVVEEIIQEVKKSMGSVELDSIINHVTGLVLKTHSVVESTRNLDLIGLFPELRKLQSDLLLLKPPKAEPMDVEKAIKVIQFIIDNHLMDVYNKLDEVKDILSQSPKPQQGSQ